MDDLKIAVPRPKEPKPRPAPRVCPPPRPKAASPLEPGTGEVPAEDQALKAAGRGQARRRAALETLNKQIKGRAPGRNGYLTDSPSDSASEANTLTRPPYAAGLDETEAELGAGGPEDRQAPGNGSPGPGPKTELPGPDGPEPEGSPAEEADPAAPVTVELDLAEIKTIPASLYQDQTPAAAQAAAAGEQSASGSARNEGPPAVDGGAMVSSPSELQSPRPADASLTGRTSVEAGPILAEQEPAEKEAEFEPAAAVPAASDREAGEDEPAASPPDEASRRENPPERRLHMASRERRKSRVRAALDRSAALRWGLVGGLVALLAAGLGLGWSYFAKPVAPAAKVARIPVANLPKVPPLTPGFYEVYARQRESAIQTEATIAQGSGLGQALEEVGLGARQRSAAIIECLTRDGGVNPNAVRAGVTLRAYWADRGRNELRRLEYHPENGAAPLVVMPRADGGFWLYNTASPPLTLNAAREGVVESSLWQAGSDAGLDAGVILTLSDILASDVDFFNDIKQGDSFQVLYSREYRDGRPQGAPIIDMVKLVNKGRAYEYYRFVGPNDNVGYYDAVGRTSHKAFFVTPLQYKRISSGFTMKRMHPIHRVVRPHQGVDYAAPSGTPVSSVADGTVIFADWNGGYGRLITIKHDETYTTMYAHLSRFAPGIKKGVKVKQGDLIGHVGATGTATGPHLDFRLKKNGVFINPVPELAKQEGRKLEPADFSKLSETITLLQKRMAEQLQANRNGA